MMLQDVNGKNGVYGGKTKSLNHRLLAAQLVIKRHIFLLFSDEPPVTVAERSKA
jgi:hypothetical protein